MIKIVSEYLHFILPIEFKDLLKILVQDLINDSMMIDQHIIADNSTLGIFYD